VNKPFISVCIPAYNRPETLRRLLGTIDFEDKANLEIVISEDMSPRRDEIREVVKRFSAGSGYRIVYRENSTNLKYDGNLKELVKAASGEWLIFMGDDDEFIPGAISKVVAFIKNHGDISYILRRYETVHADGSREDFRYYEGDKFFEPGEDTYVEVFRRSVFISGFTIKRDAVLPCLATTFKEPGLIQIYWVAEVALKSKIAYFDTQLTRQVEDPDSRAKETMFDDSKKIVSRPVDANRSLAFLSGYPTIARFMDENRGLHSYGPVMRELSKYSYPLLSIHRDKGLAIFFNYARGLSRLGFNKTIYYYICFLFVCSWSESLRLGNNENKEDAGEDPKIIMKKFFVGAALKVAGVFFEGKRYEVPKEHAYANLGCGMNCLPGWLNVDGSLTALFGSRKFRFINNLIYPLAGSSAFYSFGDYDKIIRENGLLFFDLRRGAPFKDSSLDAVFASHFLEHLREVDAMCFLGDCYRAMKKGAVLRILVPDLDLAFRMYSEGKVDEVLRTFFYTSDRFDFHAHKYGYNFSSLKERLEKIGFTDIKRMKFREGECPGIEKLDIYPELSLIVECRK